MGRSPGPPPPHPATYEIIEELGQTCRIARATKVNLTGDIEGNNRLLSAVWCIDSIYPPTFIGATVAREEGVGWLTGEIYGGEEILMKGRMTLEIDRTPKAPPYPIKGYMVFQEGVGTHYGVFHMEGTIGPRPFNPMELWPSSHSVRQV